MWEFCVCVFLVETCVVVVKGAHFKFYYPNCGCVCVPDRKKKSMEATGGMMGAPLAQQKLPSNGQEHENDANTYEHGGDASTSNVTPREKTLIILRGCAGIYLFSCSFWKQRSFAFAYLRQLLNLKHTDHSIIFRYFWKW